IHARAWDEPEAVLAERRHRVGQGAHAISSWPCLQETCNENLETCLRARGHVWPCTCDAPRAWAILCVMARTITRDGDPAPAAAERAPARLVFLASADDLAMPSSSHVLDGLDEVRFVRGPRSVARAERSLVLAFPDRRMSSVNGALVRHGD